jgi:hypothetical protein
VSAWADQTQVFGPLAPLNLDEMFSNTKDRWHKFRTRTSSANWSGTDQLTEEDIQRIWRRGIRCVEREGGLMSLVGRCPDLSRLREKLHFC